MAVSTLTQLIKSKALDLGFSEVGIARVVTLAEEGTHLQEWLRRGYHASMRWMERNLEKRIDPRKVLQNAKSIVCVALNYYSSEKHSKNSGSGKISRYAWGDDYHGVLSERLKALMEFITIQMPVAKGKIYVDTGPVMDKSWAVQAGIGWLGKHTNVINRKVGSWILLGEIILDIELDYDYPITDFCGTCTACIEACPTGAIVEPYVLDSNLCISYLTIEHRGDLPKRLVPKFDNWIFGCDICQEVCPWNRFQKETKEAAFRPRSKNITPSLVELCDLNQEEFNRRFQRSALQRIKRDGLVRNAKAVLESQSSSKQSD